mmetsp:Transcript_10505/g.30076  ORF Transcript_10505/g.30076 Transcript_10505/m.30076 type:complete len:317 (+) Transcript_10505:2310-3260(+)
MYTWPAFGAGASALYSWTYMQNRQMSVPSMVWNIMMALERKPRVSGIVVSGTPRKCLRTGVGMAHSRSTLETTRMQVESAASGWPRSRSRPRTLSSMNLLMWVWGRDAASTGRCSRGAAGPDSPTWLALESRTSLASVSDPEPSQDSLVVYPARDSPEKDRCELSGESPPAALPGRSGGQAGGGDGSSQRAGKSLWPKKVSRDRWSQGEGRSLASGPRRQRGHLKAGVDEAAPPPPRVVRPAPPCGAAAVSGLKSTQAWWYQTEQWSHCTQGSGMSSSKVRFSKSRLYWGTRLALASRSTSGSPDRNGGRTDDSPV